MALELESWLGVIKTVVMGAAVWIIWSVRHVFKFGLNTQKFLDEHEQYRRDTNRRIDLLEQLVDSLRDTNKYLESLDDRMNRAGKHMSDMATQVQRLPAELRREFMGKELFAAHERENQVSMDHLQRQLDQLWGQARTRDTPRK